jgi:outer membrane autotransporter protein
MAALTERKKCCIKGRTEVSTFVDAGYDFHFGAFAVGPLAALQYTNVHLNGFNENNQLLRLQSHSDSQDPLRTDLGVKASYRGTSAVYQLFQ